MDLDLVVLMMSENFTVYMFMYFVFKKTSKMHMNKYRWLFVLKLVFILSMIGLFCFGIVNLIYEINIRDDTAMFPNVMEKVTILKLCADPTPLVL